MTIFAEADGFVSGQAEIELAPPAIGGTLLMLVRTNDLRDCSMQVFNEQLENLSTELGTQAGRVGRLPVLSVGPDWATWGKGPIDADAEDRPTYSRGDWRNAMRDVLKVQNALLDGGVKPFRTVVLFVNRDPDDDLEAKTDLGFVLRERTLLAWVSKHSSSKLLERLVKSSGNLLPCDPDELDRLTGRVTDHLRDYLPNQAAGQDDASRFR